MKELYLINGSFYTQDSHIPHATAVAIRDNYIWAVGSDEEILPLAPSKTHVIDLEGKLGLPGMTDSHFHFYDWALGLRQLPLAETPSLAALRERLASRVKQMPAGDWILGQGWNESRWPENRVPTRGDLDDITPNHPVILWRNDLHLAVVNTPALIKAGITANTPNPPEGVIDHDPSGQPTGILRELAINLVSTIIPPPTEDETVSAMREGFKILHRLGLTGLHDFRVMGGPEGSAAFRAYQRLLAAGELNFRLWMNIPGERLDEAIALGLRSGMGDDNLRIGHVKIFADGGQGARTAWMLEPYKDTGLYGMPLTPMADIASAVRRADRAGLAVAIHAIGDHANRELLNVFDNLVKDLKERTIAPPTARHRIEHVQMIQPEDVKRLGQLGVAASVQPIHVPDDIPMIDASVGPRGRFAYPFRDLMDAGVTLAFGSDCPVASPNPLWGIHAAVTRQQQDSTPKGGWYPAQRLTVEEAVWGFTMGPALVCGQEGRLGSITPGKLADIAILEKNIYAPETDPAEIASTRVAMTILNGQIVHEL